MHLICHNKVFRIKMTTSVDAYFHVLKIVFYQFVSACIKMYNYKAKGIFLNSCNRIHLSIFKFVENLI